MSTYDNKVLERMLATYAATHSADDAIVTVVPPTIVTVERSATSGESDGDSCNN